MGSARHAFLRICEITSIVEELNGDTVVRMRDGREFSVVASGAIECWQNILEVIDPHLAEGANRSRDPFVQFSLKPIS